MIYSLYASHNINFWELETDLPFFPDVSIYGTSGVPQEIIFNTSSYMGCCPWNTFPDNPQALFFFKLVPYICKDYFLIILDGCSYQGCCTWNMFSDTNPPPPPPPPSQAFTTLSLKSRMYMHMYIHTYVMYVCVDEFRKSKVSLNPQPKTKPWTSLKRL